MLTLGNAMTSTRQARDCKDPKSRGEGQREDARWKPRALISEKCALQTERLTATLEKQFTESSHRRGWRRLSVAIESC